MNSTSTAQTAPHGSPRHPSDPQHCLPLPTPSGSTRRGILPATNSAQPSGGSAPRRRDSGFGQLDILRHSPEAMARAYLAAADEALKDYHYPAAERQRRSDYYRREAERIEREQMRAKG